jgi:hypothetical protein
LSLNDTCKSDKGLRKRNRDGMFHLGAHALISTAY